MEKFYFIVRFLKTNEVEVVSSTWVAEVESKSWWPNLESTLDLNKYLQKHEPVDRLDRLWGEYGVKILGNGRKFVSLLKANDQADKYGSDGEDDEGVILSSGNETKLTKRKRKKGVTYDERYNDDLSEDVPIRQKSNVEKKSRNVTKTPRGRKLDIAPPPAPPPRTPTPAATASNGHTSLAEVPFTSTPRSSFQNHVPVGTPLTTNYPTVVSGVGYDPVASGVGADPASASGPAPIASGSGRGRAPTTFISEDGEFAVPWLSLAPGSGVSIEDQADQETETNELLNMVSNVTGEPFAYTSGDQQTVQVPILILEKIARTLSIQGAQIRQLQAGVDVLVEHVANGNTLNLAGPISSGANKAVPHGLMPLKSLEMSETLETWAAEEGNWDVLVVELRRGRGKGLKGLLQVSMPKLLHDSYAATISWIGSRQAKSSFKDSWMKRLIWDVIMSIQKFADTEGIDGEAIKFVQDYLKYANRRLDRAQNSSEKSKRPRGDDHATN